MMDARFGNGHATKERTVELRNKLVYKYLPIIDFSSFTSVFTRGAGGGTNFLLFVIIDESSDS
jgi:hypothetical protein